MAKEGRCSAETRGKVPPNPRVLLKQEELVVRTTCPATQREKGCSTVTTKEKRGGVRLLLSLSTTKRTIYTASALGMKREKRRFVGGDTEARAWGEGGEKSGLQAQIKPSCLSYIGAAYERKGCGRN